MASKRMVLNTKMCACFVLRCNFQYRTRLSRMFPVDHFASCCEFCQRAEKAALRAKQEEEEEVRRAQAQKEKL